jgi:hypothetical protein
MSLCSFVNCVLFTLQAVITQVEADLYKKAVGTDVLELKHF